MTFFGLNFFKLFFILRLGEKSKVLFVCVFVFTAECFDLFSLQLKREWETPPVH